MFLQNRLVHHENGARRVMERSPRDGTALVGVAGTDDDQIGVGAPRDRLMRLRANQYGVMWDSVEYCGRASEHVRVVCIHAASRRELWCGVQDAQCCTTSPGEVGGVPQHTAITGTTAHQHGDAAMLGVHGSGCAAHDHRVAAARGQQRQDVATQAECGVPRTAVADDHELGAEVVLRAVDLEAGAEELSLCGGPPQYVRVTSGAVLDDHDWFHALTMVCCVRLEQGGKC